MRALRLRVPISALVVTGCVLAAATLAGYYSVRATAWAVMTDELQVARLATSIADTLSPVPAIHGVYYGAHGQLYPLLLAPFYGTLAAPAAATAAHAFNALLLASAAVPAFLLARSVAASPSAGYVAAALTAFSPWLVLASTLLTENAAYPAFVWAVFLCHRSLTAPSTARDLATLAGLLVAFFARSQLLVLAVALPIALVLHEVGFPLRRGCVRATLRTGVARTVAEHRVLVAAYAVGALAGAVLALAGSLGGVVGNYATPFSGDLVPPGLLSSAAAHFDQIVVGAGIVPAALAGSWAFTTFLRPERKEAHAFAALLVVLVPLLTLEVASFDLRFAPGAFIQERYLFYLVPLFAVGAAAWLAQRTQRTLRLVTLVLAGAALAALLGLAAYEETVIFWASPAAAFHPEVAAASVWLGLSATLVLQLAAIALVLVVVASAWRTPRVALVGTAVIVAGFGAAQAGFVFDRYAEPALTRPSGGDPRDWIDASVPRGASVALVPGGYDGPAAWWEAELWNRSVDRVLRVGSGSTFTPFPAHDVSIDYEGGVLDGPQPSEYLVISASETRFHLVGATPLASDRDLRLVRVPRPYRVAWATRGLTPDGWTRPDRRTALRLYGHGGAEWRTISLTLAASRFSPRPVSFVLRGRDSVLDASVDPGGARPPVELDVCVPAGGHAEVWLTSTGRTRLPDGRTVALHVEKLVVSKGGRCTTDRREIGIS
jgi:hypothetical protein